MSVIGIVVIMVVGYALLSNGALSGNFHSYLVQSGSMEPNIMTGDVIFVSTQERYVKNDVITFKENDGRIVTHRIVDIQLGTFTTKGDANRAEDNGSVPPKNVIGKVFFTVPKLGYLIAFSRTLPGFVILIAVPSLLLIIMQVFSL